MENGLTYDLMLRGGEVIDSRSGRRERKDVGVREGLIESIAAELPSDHADRVIDVTGKLVTPGLVDLHAHGYWGVTYDGVNVDAVAGRSGVTTWVDAGSAGSATFPGFRRYVIEQSRTRILPFLNLCATGIIYQGVMEFNDLRYADVPFAVEMIEEHRDLIAGVKLRLGRGIVGNTGDHAVWLAREVADHAGLPIMVHIGVPPPPLRQILDALGPGDIVTHCFRGDERGVGGILLNGKIRPEVVDARERGILFDVGHGAGSFGLTAARSALDQGFLTDTISSDLHQQSILKSAHSLPNVMSKFLALGMPLEDVVRLASASPANVLGREDIGYLREGAVADVAVFEVETGVFEFDDVYGNKFEGAQRLRNVLTLRAGEAMSRDLDYGALPLFRQSRNY